LAASVLIPVALAGCAGSGGMGMKDLSWCQVGGAVAGATAGVVMEGGVGGGLIGGLAGGIFGSFLCLPDGMEVKDSDGDGVPDDKDQCPGTPAGAPVDENGCPLYSDGDGVPDYLDKCPGTPAGVKVDPDGCPLDSDGDGVSDDKDRCPNTAAGTQVDANGCPILFRDNKPTLILEGVNFETGKAELHQSSRAILLTVAQALAGNPDVRVEVGGHTDITGSRATNARLSQERADVVRNFLIANGVKPEQLTAKGYGPDVPIASNRTAEGRASNRRTELKKIN
jgi:OOP family OmpA-OmpF porin